MCRHALLVLDSVFYKYDLIMEKIMTKNTKPYRVRLLTTVDVEIEVNAENEDVAKAKAYQWTGNYANGYSEVGDYTIYHGDDTHDDLFDDSEMYWTMQGVEVIKCVSVMELEEGEKDKPSDTAPKNDLIEDELPRIARLCVANNWRRTDGHYGGWHYFTNEELVEINRNTGNNFDTGYCFLDDDDTETAGLIRLEEGNSNPKWSFWLEDGQVKIDCA
jgi:hypothetical protein